MNLFFCQLLFIFFVFSLFLQVDLDLLNCWHECLMILWVGDSTELSDSDV